MSSSVIIANDTLGAGRYTQSALPVETEYTSKVYRPMAVPTIRCHLSSLGWLVAWVPEPGMAILSCLQICWAFVLSQYLHKSKLIKRQFSNKASGTDTDQSTRYVVTQPKNFYLL